MASTPTVVGTRFTVRSHALAGVLTVATWLTLCAGFGLEVAPARDPVDRLYQMDAERDALARQAARAAAPLRPTGATLSAPRPPAPVPGT